MGFVEVTRSAIARIEEEAPLFLKSILRPRAIPSKNQKPPKNFKLFSS